VSYGDPMSTTSRTLHPLAALGLILVALGAIAWIWLGEWRWFATAIVLFLALASVGAALEQKSKH
jgi:hypothetical protein